MELKPGYKQTEVGVIPDDWDVKQLGELASVTAGGTPSRKEAKFWNGDIPWITTSEVDFCKIRQAEQFITLEGLNNSAAKLLPIGTLLMALYGQGKTRGKVGILDMEATTNQACAAIQLKPGVSIDFIFHYLVSQYEVIRNLSNTGNQENLNSSIVRSISIHLPPEIEQQDIATALSDIDALLEELDHLITKKRDLKQATMQQLLTGQTRLPGFGEGNSYKQTEVGVIPEDWLTLKIGDLFDFKNGLNKAKRFFGSGTPIVNYMDVFHNPGLHKADILGKVTLSAEEIRAYGVRQGDVFFTRTSETVEEIGITTVLLEDVENGVFSGFVLRARPKTSDVDLDLLFKKYCFDSEVVRRQITATSSYTTRALTNGRLLSQVILPCPSQLEEQHEIAIALSDIDIEIAILEQRRDKTRALKQGMMQELLTGRTRLV